MTITQEVWDQLKRTAKAMTKQSYAPYSGQHVGSAVLVVGPDGAEYIVGGCNVENGSYGSTVCGEVNSVTSAVSLYGPEIKIRAFAVFGDRDEWESPRQFEPCGNCRSVIFQFATDDCLMAWSPEPVPFNSIFSFLDSGEPTAK